jgi:glyoxylate reductase
MAAKQHDGLITMLSDKIDKEFLEENSHLKVITNYAVGFNNIDVETATKLNIAIGNTPDVLTEATADLALCLLLDVSRKISSSVIDTKDGKWNGWEPLGYIGQSLRRKKIGIFGAGRIGQKLASTLKNAFDMEIVYTTRTKRPAFEKETGATKVDFNELLETSDVLSVHCDLNETTNGIFNKEAFDKMKSSSIFINTARGQVHNEQDLLIALENKSIWGAGLDVTNPEPIAKTSKLLKNENVTITPHIGSATLSARTEMAKIVATNIVNAFECKKLAGDVNNLFK